MCKQTSAKMETIPLLWSYLFNAYFGNLLVSHPFSMMASKITISNLLKDSLSILWKKNIMFTRLFIAAEVIWYPRFLIISPENDTDLAAIELVLNLLHCLKKELYQNQAWEHSKDFFIRFLRKILINFGVEKHPHQLKIYGASNNRQCIYWGKILNSIFLFRFLGRFLC